MNYKNLLSERFKFLRPNGLLHSLLFALFLFACGQRVDIKEEKITEQAMEDTSARKAVDVGGQKDEHGCLVAAGYTWSQLKQECVRIFETGIRLNPQDTSLDQTTSAFIIFNDDQTTVELFLPFEKGSLLLERTGTEGKYQWKNGDYALSVWKGYVLKDGSKTLYQGG